MNFGIGAMGNAGKGFSSRQKMSRPELGHCLNSMMMLPGLVCSLATVALSTPVWDGVDEVGFVASGGTWYEFDDNKESANNGPGASSSDFPSSSPFDDVIGTWVQESGDKIEVNFRIPPTSYKLPYAGIGFHWMDPVEETPQTWTNICVEYALTGEIPMCLEIELDPAVDGGNAYCAKLYAQPTMSKTCFSLPKFSQEMGWGTKLPIAQAMQKSTGMRFRAFLKSPPTSEKTANLQIQSICTDCDGKSVAVPRFQAHDVKVIQAGRKISIRDLGGAPVTVELVSLQGKVIARAPLVSATEMDLSSVAQGLYVLRVVSDKINLTQRIAVQ